MESDKPGIDREFHESVSVRNYLMKVFDKDTYRRKSSATRPIQVTRAVEPATVAFEPRTVNATSAATWYRD
jgi:hypothetical protein